jgi:alkylated DNA repair dioxygenase AlkB
MDFVALYKAESEKLRNGQEEQQKVNPPVASKAPGSWTNFEDLHIRLNFDDRNKSNLFSLSDYCVVKSKDLYYIPNIVDEMSANLLKERIWEEGARNDKWVSLRNRQCQVWSEQEALSSDQGHQYPQWIRCISQQLIRDGLFTKEEAPNHLLVNQYPDVGGGISHHTDGPDYLELVCIISIGGPTVMTFKERLNTEQIGLLVAKEPYKVILEHNSMLVFSKELYTNYMHGIYPDSEVDVGGDLIDDSYVNTHLINDQDMIKSGTIKRGERISLTFRKHL